MTGTAVLNALFGAALVALGVLTAALADYIRGIRLQRERAARDLTPRAAVTPAPARAARAPIEVVERRVFEPRREAGDVSEAELMPPSRALKPKTPGVESKMKTMADDVIAALVAAGYKRPNAAEATWGCNAAERSTIEHWTAAALQKAGRGSRS